MVWLMIFLVLVEIFSVLVLITFFKFLIFCLRAFLFLVLISFLIFLTSLETLVEVSDEKVVSIDLASVSILTVSFSILVTVS